MAESDLLRHQVRRFPSPLRYPGGKGSVTNFIKLVFLANDLVGTDYAEPYAGGASVGLSLLFEGYADHIYINDLDRSVFAFWNAVLTDTDRICALINDTEITVDEWTRQRAVQTATDPELLDLAFSTFFLNRTNRSGIITGGIIGGRRQDGPWKLDARYNKSDLIRRIQKIARFRSRVSLSNLDALAFLSPWCADNAPSGFLYLDPPYHTKGGDLYRNYYGREDHVAVAASTRKLRASWIVSYDDDTHICDLYRSRRSLRYPLSYSAAARGKGAEVMFFSPHLKVPKVHSPARIPDAMVDAELAATISGHG